MGIGSGYLAGAKHWGLSMEWTAPAFEEVCLNCEINSYASAKL
jgi:coenzyme PQQ precursor peptide PqqA